MKLVGKTVFIYKTIGLLVSNYPFSPHLRENWLESIVLHVRQTLQNSILIGSKLAISTYLRIAQFVIFILHTTLWKFSFIRKTMFYRFDENAIRFGYSLHIYLRLTCFPFFDHLHEALSIFVALTH